MTDSEAAPPAGAPPGADSGKFDIPEAAFHVFHHANTVGREGLIRLGVIFFVLAFIITVIPMVAGLFMFGQFADAMRANDPQMLLGPGLALAGVWLAYLFFYGLLYAATDAALLRWLYGGPARLRLDGDTLRIVVVCSLWALMWAVIFLPPPVIAAVLNNGAGVAILILLWLAGAPLWIFLATRMAPAGALSVAEHGVRFRSAWGATRGVLWPLMGAFVIVFAIYMGASMAMQLVTQPIAMLVMGEQMTAMMVDPQAEMTPEEAAALLEMLTGPGFIGLTVFSGILYVALSFVFQAMLAGVNAYQVKRVRPGI